MAKAAAEGHRVVLVLATRGEVGEVESPILDDGESLGDRREREVHEAAKLLGVHRVEFLGYRDSGMMGEATNDAPDCFWQADIDEAAAKLAAILRGEGADSFTCYDDHGGYGHPDHIQVHRVGHRAAELAGTDRVYEATINRDHIVRLRELAAASGIETPLDEDADDGGIDVNTFGTPEDQITTAVDVSAFVKTKRDAMAAHSSQIDGESFFLQLPDEQFGIAFGTEWFIRTDSLVEGLETSLFAPQ